MGTETDAGAPEPALRLQHVSDTSRKGCNQHRSAQMNRIVLSTALGASITSAALTALVLLAVAPAAIQAAGLRPLPKLAMDAGSAAVQAHADAAGTGLAITYANGKPIACIGTLDASQDGPPEVQATNAKGPMRFRASLDENGLPSLHLFDASANLIWSAP
jgi:hypothetical protein